MVKPSANEFAKGIFDVILDYDFNAELDNDEIPLGEKIKKYHHIPNLIIVGEREAKNNQVVWRKLDGSQEVIDLKVFHERMKNIKNPLKNC